MPAWLAPMLSRFPFESSTRYANYVFPSAGTGNDEILLPAPAATGGTLRTGFALWVEATDLWQNLDRVSIPSEPQGWKEKRSFPNASSIRNAKTKGSSQRLLHAGPDNGRR
ncbi:hypothetical protein ZHAS_00017890 [Anopheles sinensis]|uniref:Uncharacterized protein n=1 Tax=Anopheles sinensis TaxID=74873 RepID=A0A084WI21_ANOSI|nr:hypothetical protein ZHAS_00017890 [Anopheles sinensis]